jgi:hypothetical protein
LLQRQLCSVITSVVVGVTIESVTAASARVFEMSESAFLVLDPSKTLAIAYAYLALLRSCSNTPAVDAL